LLSTFASVAPAVKRTLVCLIVACVSLSAARELPAPVGTSVNVERLLRFSGTLAETHRTFIGAVDLSFMMYDEPQGGTANWQEAQNVQLDAQGRYVVLLGAKTVGGLPADIFASGKAHWLGVRASGQSEQPRVLLVGLSSALDTGSTASAKTSAGETPLHQATDRYITLLLAIMFLVGMGLTYLEVRKWWKTRMDQFQPPPLANLINYIPGPDRRWRATQVLPFSLPDLRAIRERLQHSVQNMDDDQPKKSA
jgi:hypothetical protein